MSETKFSDRIRNFEETWLPRRSPRRFLAYLAISAAVAIPVGEHIGDHVIGTGSHQVSNDLQPEIEKQGKDVQETATDIQEKVQDIAKIAHNVNDEIDALKKALGEIGIVIPDKTDTPHADRTTSTTLAH